MSGSLFLKLSPFPPIWHLLKGRVEDSLHTGVLHEVLSIWASIFIATKHMMFSTGGKKSWPSTTSSIQLLGAASTYTEDERYEYPVTAVPRHAGWEDSWNPTLPLYR